MADRRVVKLRPVPQEPCRRREEPASVQGALRPGCPRGRSERRSNRCECVLRGDHRESEAQSFRSRPLGGCSESKARSYAAGPGFGGRESSRFLGTKRWKSQKLRQLSPERTSEWKGSGRVLGQLDPNHLLRSQHRPNNAYFRHSHRVSTRRTQRSSFRFRNATRVSASAFQRWVVWPLRPKPLSAWVSGGSVSP